MITTSKVANGFVCAGVLSMSSSSGDLLADRRYEWGAGALKDRDFEGAADLFQQVIEIAPQWAAAYLSLGDALMGLGDPAGAQIAWGDAARLDPSGVLGAALKIAASGAGRAPASRAIAAIGACASWWWVSISLSIRDSISCAFRLPDTIMRR